MTGTSAPSIFYAASTGGFYRSDIHEDVPADAVPITEAVHADLLAAQSTGSTIVTGPEGLPIAQAPAAPSIDELRARAVAAVKHEAQRRILAVAPLWRQMNDLADPTPAGVTRRAEIGRLRTRSNAIEADAATLDATALAAFDPTADARWA